MPLKEKLIKRIFEVYPGLLAWACITCPIWGGIFFPEMTAYFILVFNAFWVYKSLSTGLFYFMGYFRVRNGENTDWMSKLKRLENLTSSIREIKSDIADLKHKKFDWKEYNDPKFKKLPVLFQKIIFIFGKKKTIKHLKDELNYLETLNEKKVLDWRKIRHVVIIPYWREPYAVLKRNLDRLVNQSFPNKQITVVLGAEERYPPAFKLAKKLQERYKDKFEHVWINNHALAGEDIVGKASNMANAGRFALKQIEKLGWDKNKITITSCDSDTQFHLQYFAYLTYLFVTDDDRYKHFYAAPMVYYANIWKVPFYSRIANTTFTINNIANSARIDKFIQLSSYSFSWRLLEDIDFWSVDVIPEDFHMFFKALFIYEDRVMTKPIYLKNLNDAAESIGHVGTIKNQYEQVKRWAWGVSDHGWMIRNWLRSRKTLYVTYRVFHTIFDHITWSIISFILLFGANIPTLINKNFSRTVFGQKLPKVASFMMTMTTIAFISTIILDFFIKPRRKKKVSILQIILEQFQWITFPIVSFIFGAVPGLDAQTRLLFAKYMEYRLTEKH